MTHTGMTLRRWARTALATFTSFSMVLAGIPPAAMAQGTSYGGQGGSITIDMIDLDTGQPVTPGTFRPGQRIRIVPKAFGPQGQSLPCTPSYAPIQGVTGNQIQAITNDGVMTMGPGFGSAEVSVKCKELPDVQHKTYIANRPVIGQAARQAEAQAAQQAAAQQAAAAPAASSGGGTVMALLLGAGAIGLAAAAASGLGGGGSSSSAPKSCSSGQFCRTSGGKEGCCQSGGFVQLCHNTSGCANIAPFTDGACPGEPRTLNCCGGAPDCGINAR